MTTSATLTPYLTAAATAELEDWGPLEEGTGDPMGTWGVTLWEDGAVSVGVWECEAGPSRWLLEQHESIHLLAGRMTVQPDGGAAIEMGPGDVAVFPKGWSGTWQIHEKLRKVYTLF
jgi:uncharacterized protein